MVQDVWALCATSPSGLCYKVRRGQGASLKRPGDPACLNLEDGYYRGQLDGVKYKAHRVVFFLTNGYWPECVDHKDGNRANNSTTNLRGANKQINAHNTVHRGTKRLPNGRWFARIVCSGKSHSLGTYSTEQAAHETYLQAKQRLHPTAPERCYEQ